MPQNRARHSAEFKAKVALAALTEAKTLAEISSEYKVHSTRITRWKQELLEKAAELFSKGKKLAVNPADDRLPEDLMRHRKPG